MKKVTNVINDTNFEKLKQNYMEACSDEDFYKYVSSLPASEDELIKHTSILQESFMEFCNCNKCKKIDECKNKVNGYRLVPEFREKNISFSYISCDKLNKLEEKNKYLKNVKYYNISKELQNASFKDLYKVDSSRVPILKYMNDFIKKYTKNENVKGLYLNGSFGSGKTYLVSALFNDLAKKGYKGVIVYYPEFIRDLKSSFKTDYDEKFNYIRKAPLLLLDDIGAENVSNYNRDEVLGPIIQYRMEENLPTFFTSNLTLDELEKNLSITSSGVDKIKARRIIERIKQLTESLELISKNRRH